MASHISHLTILALALVFLVQGALGGITCEDLKEDRCSFAVSSSGKRCVLEKGVRRSGAEVFICRSSEIETNNLKDWIETDQCIGACGLDRNSFGISTDSLLESKFTQKLCSPQCYESCPNIIDLYFNIAAAEGVWLHKLCEGQQRNDRRVLAEIQSSGIVAPGPVSSNMVVALAPAMAPF